MINIKRFIEKVSHTEGRQGKDVVIPISEARILRDELAMILADFYDAGKQENKAPEQVIQVEITGGKF
jgi:hypothetical protein